MYLLTALEKKSPVRVSKLTGGRDCLGGILMESNPPATHK